MKAKLGEQREGADGEGCQARGTHLPSIAASAGVNPGLSVALGAVWLLLITMYLFARCHESTGDFIRAGKRSLCL